MAGRRAGSLQSVSPALSRALPSGPDPDPAVRDLAVRRAGHPTRARRLPWRQLLRVRPTGSRGGRQPSYVPRARRLYGLAFRVSKVPARVRSRLDRQHRQAPGHPRSVRLGGEAGPDADRDPHAAGPVVPGRDRRAGAVAGISLDPWRRARPALDGGRAGDDGVGIVEERLRNGGERFTFRCTRGRGRSPPPSARLRLRVRTRIAAPSPGQGGGWSGPWPSSPTAWCWWVRSMAPVSGVGRWRRAIPRSASSRSRSRWAPRRRSCTG